MTMPVNSASAKPTADSAAPDATAAAGALAQRETFLKLLVAQIRNQNPLQPADAIQFVSQLAQFSELEQMIQIRAELESIREALAAQGAGAPNHEGAN